jgi:transcriptional regulator with XRE-family HTH domain
MYRFKLQALLDTMNEKKWNQAELANAMGVSVGCVSRVLSEDRKPGLDFILGLKKAFPQYTLDYFFELNVLQGKQTDGATVEVRA